jgi:DNA end-binding protein Ku
MARSIWNGVVSFGMVSIPVKLYTATESKDISFNLLHKTCGSRLKQLRWCPVDDKEVPWDEIERGYAYAKDQYVVLTDEDFEKLPLPSKHTIELSAFVKAEEIDPVYYEKSYYVEPDETGLKPFALLMRALKKKDLTAIAKIAIRNKERLCALRPYDGTLVIETLYYPDEVRLQKGSEAPEVKISDKELQMALSLIELMEEEEFKPEEYKDNYREALMDLINAKLQGSEIVEAPAAPQGKVIDLMTALKASVDAAKTGRKPAAATKRAASRNNRAAPAPRRRKAASG